MSGPRAQPARFRLGLVVGKFAPLHLGHEWLIQQATRQCDRLLILSYTRPEFPRCAPDARRRWFAQRFPGHEALVLDQATLDRWCFDGNILPCTLPRNDADDRAQQDFLAWLLGAVLRRAPDAIFCSEAYGSSCAEVLSRELRQEVAAVIVDPERIRFPCSGREIRRDPESCRRWLSPEVRASFIQRVAILGGESSGKTTLAAALAERFGTSWVPEYGRELWEQQGGVLLQPDLLKIARMQVRREEAAAAMCRRYLFCDTSPLTTAGYSLWMFGQVSAELMTLASRTYDAVILCQPDFPFVQDGTRRDEEFRLQQHAWYEHKLATAGVPVLQVAGNTRARVASVAGFLATQDCLAAGKDIDE